MLGRGPAAGRGTAAAMDLQVELIFEEFCAHLVRTRTLPIAERHSEWTHAVKRSIGRLGERRGFTVLTTDDRRKSGSYLWDVAWAREDAPSRVPTGAGIPGLHFPRSPYRQLVLSAQVEWGKPGQRGRTQMYRMNLEEVFRDFYKLLDAKSEVKVMVFTSWLYPGQGGPTGEAVKGLQQILADYRAHLPGERYLFIEFFDVGRQILGYRCQVPRRGPKNLQIVAVGHHGYPSTW